MPKPKRDPFFAGMSTSSIPGMPTINPDSVKLLNQANKLDE